MRIPTITNVRDFGHVIALGESPMDSKGRVQMHVALYRTEGAYPYLVATVERMRDGRKLVDVLRDRHGFAERGAAMLDFATRCAPPGELS